jgi:hypothetical protein
LWRNSPVGRYPINTPEIAEGALAETAKAPILEVPDPEDAWEQQVRLQL